MSQYISYSQTSRKPMNQLGGKNCTIMSCVGVIYKTWFWIGFIAPYSHTNSGIQVIQCYHYSTHFAVHRSTSTRVLGLH
jgi:hypothetical protein